MFLAGKANDAFGSKVTVLQSHNSSLVVQSECYLASRSHLSKYCFILGLFLRQWSSQSLGLDQFPDCHLERENTVFFQIAELAPSGFEFG